MEGGEKFVSKMLARKLSWMRGAKNGIGVGESMASLAVV